MASKKGMSEYELKRLKRIQENQKMLEELFPGGTPDLMLPSSSKATRKRRVQPLDANSLGTGSGSDASDEEGSTPKAKRAAYRERKVLVYPRRNPSRKARPDSEASRPMTRSISRAINGELTPALEDDQEVKRAVYRTVRSRVATETDEPPVELDDAPAAYNAGRHVVIPQRSSDKVYDRAKGTTCHQCRQKTIDTKTVCHNKNCKGVRGQFCSPCLLNRYGEGLLESLRNREWVCPPCRKICNCSFCLPKRGKPPTGILIHHAKEAGYDSVHEYLDKTNYDY